MDEEIKSAEQTKMEILKLYEEDPQGWHILIGKDMKGYRNISVIHGKDLWLIKEEAINPFKSVGCALKTTLNKKLPLTSEITFGLRPIQGSFDNVEALLKVLLEEKPIPLSKITSPYVAEGPYIFSDCLKNLLAPSQIELENRLTAELDCLIERKYGYLRRIYG